MSVFCTLIHRFLASVMAVLVASAGTPAWACEENAMVVFDASGSMSVMHDEERRIDTARSAAADIIPEIARRRPTGLVTYGGVPGPVCSGVSLRIPPVRDSGGMILGELGMLDPSGQTPLTDAVWLAAQTLRGYQKPGLIVLITDGLENCGSDPCALGQKIRALTPKIRVHVIGFHLNSSGEGRVACLAKATEGSYSTTDSLDTLRSALQNTLACPRIS
jgi:Ca-activated chloride channel homolog